MEGSIELLGAGVAMIGVLGSGIGVGLIGKGWLEALSRNPEMEQKYFMAAILPIAFAEAIAILAFIVAIMIS